MLDWLKNLGKEYPDFYKEYITTFEKKSSKFIALSLETTGLSPTKDVIVSIAAIAIENDTILLGDSFEVVIPQYKYLHDNGITNEFFHESALPKLVEPEAAKAFLQFIKNATLIGHRIHFDIEMLNTILERAEAGRIKNDALDIEVMYKKLTDINDKTFTINELSELFKIAKSERVTAMDDAFSIALLFLKLKSRLGL
jgi:DNA polymerase-3 subunit epsilon